MGTPRETLNSFVTAPRSDGDDADGCRLYRGDGSVGQAARGRAGQGAPGRLRPQEGFAELRPRKGSRCTRLTVSRKGRGRGLFAHAAVSRLPQLPVEDEGRLAGSRMCARSSSTWCSATGETLLGLIATHLDSAAVGSALPTASSAHASPLHKLLLITRLEARHALASPLLNQGWEPVMRQRQLSRRWW